MHSAVYLEREMFTADGFPYTLRVHFFEFTYIYTFTYMVNWVFLFSQHLGIRINKIWARVNLCLDNKEVRRPSFILIRILGPKNAYFGVK